MIEKDYISAKYISEKLIPIETLIRRIENAETDNIKDDVDNIKNEVAFAFAVIAKELGVKIPEV